MCVFQQFYNDLSPEFGELWQAICFASLELFKNFPTTQETGLSPITDAARIRARDVRNSLANPQLLTDQEMYNLMLSPNVN
jgi:hypothetical protein